MSIRRPEAIPSGESSQRAAAKESLWRLAALAFSHPIEEQFATMIDGSFQVALNNAWYKVNGHEIAIAMPSGNFGNYEAGYIATFLHYRRGKPLTSLRAGDHEKLLQGLSRSVFMLNISNFYRHFGLQAAMSDEGRQDEPDHMASMMEFMAVLCHLEARARAAGRDASPYRRAQRDFLSRFLQPLLVSNAKLLKKNGAQGLDPVLLQLVFDIENWARMQISELELQEGPYIDPDDDQKRLHETGSTQSATQNLWG